MAPSFRNVLARYREDSDEYDFDERVPWMDYVKSKDQQEAPKAPPAVLDMLKSRADKNKSLDEGFDQYDPYDYDDPSNKPKDQKDAPPFTSIINPNIDYGLFMGPHVFKEDGPLYDWYKARNEDWTDQENEQNPAMSLTNKLAHVVGIYLSDMCECEEDHLRSKTAASINDIIKTDHHYKNIEKAQRAAQCNVVWQNRNNDRQTSNGFFTFKVSSPGSNKGAHNVYFQFLRPPEGTRLKPRGYIDYPVQVACSCPSFLYYGAQYYAVHGSYMYMPAFRPDLVSPKPQWQTSSFSVSPRYPMGKRHPGRGLNFRVCKHILAALDKEISRWKIEAHFEKYPVTAPPSKVMNKDVWRRLMKFDFTEDEIKRRLRSPKPSIPAFFNREDITPSVIEWFNTSWMPLSDVQKMRALDTMVEFPERIFFILIKEAYLKGDQGGRLSESVLNHGYDLMAKTVQPDNDQEPQTAEGVPEAKEEGTGFSPPGGQFNAAEFAKGRVVERPGKGLPERVKSYAKRVSPAIKPVNVIKRFQESAA